MPIMYEIYDGNYSFKLINKPIGENKQTSISLGDDNTRIYTKESGTIQFTANLIIDKDLTITQSLNVGQNLNVGTGYSSTQLLNIYNRLAVNTPTPHNSVTVHVRNGNNSIATPPTFNTLDLLLLENATGSYLQLSSNADTTSGIGFSTTSVRNRGSIEYNFNSNTMSFTANNTTSMTLDANGLNVNVVNIANILYTNVTTVSNNATSITADFSNTSIVVVKGLSGSATTITLTIPVTTTNPHKMRIIYLLVKSNGNYNISSATTGSTGIIRLPSSYPISVSSSGKYDMYSFLTNGQDAFCTFAYNYEFTSTGVLN